MRGKSKSALKSIRESRESKLKRARWRLGTLHLTVLNMHFHILGSSFLSGDEAPLELPNSNFKNKKERVTRALTRDEEEYKGIKIGVSVDPLDPFCPYPRPPSQEESEKKQNRSHSFWH